MESSAPAEDTTTGIRHSHSWTAVEDRPALQRAHDSLRWDVSKSRVLAIEACECLRRTAPGFGGGMLGAGCAAHKICERPYR